MKLFRVLRKRWRTATHPVRQGWAWVQAVPQLHQQVARLTAEVEGLDRQLTIHQRETRLLHRLASRPPVDLWLEKPVAVDGEPATQAITHSTLCREADFREPWFSYWCSRLGDTPRYHRKLWEFVFVCQGLWERGMLAPERRGLGFGVGHEALPALFAAHGCEIVGTDMAADAASALGWIASAQHAQEHEGLRRPDICADEIFDRHVSFRACDMNDIPSDLQGFDFCWSSCAFEHLGSIELGLAFIENSLNCLKPGGYGIHTTEYNVYSNDETVDHDGTVLFRRTDFEALSERLAAKGHRVVALSFEPGEGLIDNYIDVPPFAEQATLKIAMLGFATTSFGLIVQRGEGDVTATQGPDPLAAAG